MAGEVASLLLSRVTVPVVYYAVARRRTHELELPAEGVPA
jgi:hypothetical protein